MAQYAEVRLKGTLGQELGDLSVMIITPEVFHCPNVDKYTPGFTEHKLYGSFNRSI